MSDIDPAVEQVLRLASPTLAQDTARRHARRLALRVRNISCEGVITGSGFALDRHTLVTNRHVLAGADELEVETSDGRDLTVTAAYVASLGDIGIVEVAERIPAPARAGKGARRDDPVTIVGFPHGGAVTITRGTVVDRVDGTPFDIPGPVMRVTARAKPGSSGSPVLNNQGRVIAVVFAGEIATGLTLAIPLGTLHQLAETAGYEDVPPCGAE